MKIMTLELEKINRFNQESVALSNEGQYTAALVRLNSAIDECYCLGDLLINKGLILEKVGNIKYALEYFKAASVIQECNYLVSNYIASLYYDLKYYKESAFYYLKSLQQNSGHIYSWTGLGYAELGLNDIDKAMKAFTEALKLDPAWTNALIGKVQCFIQRKDYQTALKTITYVLSIDAERNDALELKSQIEKSIGENTTFNNKITFIGRQLRDNIDVKVIGSSYTNKWRSFLEESL